MTNEGRSIAKFLLLYMYSREPYKNTDIDGFFLPRQRRQTTVMITRGALDGSNSGSRARLTIAMQVRRVEFEATATDTGSGV